MVPTMHRYQPSTRSDLVHVLVSKGVTNGQPLRMLLGVRNRGNESAIIAGVNGRFTQPNEYDKAMRNVIRREAEWNELTRVHC